MLPAPCLVAVMLLLLVARPAAAADQPQGAAAGDPAAQAPVQTFGQGDQTLYLVDHGDTWSMHAESVEAQSIFDGWHRAGGPELVSKMILDFPFTLSLHRVTTERIVERVLAGYGYTLHYDAAGHLERVRVYSPQPARMFKTPRLVETLGSWRQVETPSPSMPASPSAVAPAPPAADGAAETPAANDGDDEAPAVP